MTRASGTDDIGHRLDEAMESIRLPLENLEFTIEQYLLENGTRLDLDTRRLLAGVRDCVGRAAVSTRRLSRHEPAGRPAAEDRPPLSLRVG